MTADTTVYIINRPWWQELLIRGGIVLAVVVVILLLGLLWRAITTPYRRKRAAKHKAIADAEIEAFRQRLLAVRRCTPTWRERYEEAMAPQETENQF